MKHRFVDQSRFSARGTLPIEDTIPPCSDPGVSGLAGDGSHQQNRSEQCLGELMREPELALLHPEPPTAAGDSLMGELPEGVSLPETPQSTGMRVNGGGAQSHPPLYSQQDIRPLPPGLRSGQALTFLSDGPGTAS